ncbi:MAG: OmpA family protein [Steroidobacteraceae bacterium]
MPAIIRHRQFREDLHEAQRGPVPRHDSRHDVRGERRLGRRRRRRRQGPSAPDPLPGLLHHRVREELRRRRVPGRRPRRAGKEGNRRRRHDHAALLLPTLQLGIEGHTDNVGDAASNKKLSEARAKSVTAAIVASGVETARLSAAGFGQDKPVADNRTEEGRAKNRRVELVKKS